ncbi:hypothetical protein FI667_g5653, partial [Globisporangium splendens]
MDEKILEQPVHRAVLLVLRFSPGVVIFAVAPCQSDLFPSFSDRLLVNRRVGVLSGLRLRFVCAAAHSFLFCSSKPHCVFCQSRQASVERLVLDQREKLFIELRNHVIQSSTLQSESADAAETANIEAVSSNSESPLTSEQPQQLYLPLAHTPPQPQQRVVASPGVEILEPTPPTQLLPTISRPPSLQHPRSPTPQLHLPQSVADEQEDDDASSSTLPQLVSCPPAEDDKNKAGVSIKWEASPMEQQADAKDTNDLPWSPSPRFSSVENIRALYHKRNFANSEFYSSTPALVTTVTNNPSAASAPNFETASPRFIHQKTIAASQRRATVMHADEISHHALERLGVDTDMLKKEKGMKKLGISDVDIARSEELRRYTGIATKCTSAKYQKTKAELVFGFTSEQMQRDKAIKRLGTTEQEVFDDYCRRISRLDMHERSMTSF